MAKRIIRSLVLFGFVCFCLWPKVNSHGKKHRVSKSSSDSDGNDKEVKNLKQSNEDRKDKSRKVALEKTTTSHGEKRQMFAPEHLVNFQGPPPVNHIIEKPLFHHQVHYIPKPFPVLSVQYVPKPVPVPYAVPPNYHVSHLHMRHYYHLNPCQGGGIWVRVPHDYFCICPKQLRGKNCEAHNYCSSEPCMNGATCVETADSFRCICPKGFLGIICEIPNPCYPSPCMNGGTCTKSDSEKGFLCECKEGFTGEHCEGFNRCNPSPCKNGGSCQQIAGDKYVCVCTPNFKGPLCEEPSQCYINPCMNGGTCHESETGYKCSCRIGFTGRNCESHVCHPNPCHHGGHCSVDSGHYRCVCPPIYRGHICEVPHPCYTHPCQNDGVCVDSYSGYSAYPDNWDTGYLHYLCLCKPGFMGANCEQDICKHCDVNAKCLNNTCICIDGYFGDGFHCRKIPHPCHPNPCKNKGVCKELESGEYDCKCPPGTTGKHCEDKDPCKPNPCQNNGKCLAQEDGTTKCVCENGHTGANCELVIDPCQSNPCHNSGTCINDNGKAVCKCKGKYTGQTCKECDCPKGNKNANPPEFAQTCDLEGECVCPSADLVKSATGCVVGRTSTVCDSNPCKNGGTCTAVSENAFSCECTNDWTGLTCEKPVCTDGYCQNNGICEARNHKPYCLCQAGFYGPRCEQVNETKPIDHCHPNPCLNGGTCTPIYNSYDCHCAVEYTGAHCEVDKCAKCDVHAVCIHGRCQCIDGHIGTGYECVKVPHTHCPVTCPVYSTCSHGSCQCIPGYVMTAGQCTPPQPQCPTPCPTYSTCSHGTCQCNPGYTMDGNHCTRITVYAITDGNEEEEEEETPTPTLPPTDHIASTPSVTRFSTNLPPFPNKPTNRPPRPTFETTSQASRPPKPTTSPAVSPTQPTAPLPTPVTTPEPSPQPATAPPTEPVPSPQPATAPPTEPVPAPQPATAPPTEPVPAPQLVTFPTAPPPAPVPQPQPATAPASYAVPNNQGLNDLAGTMYEDQRIDSLGHPPRPGNYWHSTDGARLRSKELAALKYRKARLKNLKYSPKSNNQGLNDLAGTTYEDQRIDSLGHPPRPGNYWHSTDGARLRSKELAALKYRKARLKNLKYPPKPNYHSYYNNPPAGAAAPQPGQDSFMYYYNKAPIEYTYPPVYLGAYPQPSYSYPSYYRYNRYGRG